MSQFYTDDICAFKADPSIVGYIVHTWRDVDGDVADSTDCYFHRDTPKEVRHDFLVNLRPSPGYVIVGFEQLYDFECLVLETALNLRDRALSAGDVVKRQLADAPSGTVISTSLSCDLRPLCSIEKYNANNLAPAHGELTKSAAAVKPSGLGKNNQASEQLTGISAQELKFWSQFREEDYVIYQDWVGQIQVVTDEVTIRLSNGSVVVMQNPDELEEPYWLPGTPSSELHRSLLRLDFELHHTQNKMKPGKAWEAEPCYPGQILETKKGNLRRGVWKFGAYDPNIRPRGIVVDVRTVDVAVVWLYPNLFQPGRTGRSPPPDDLGVDILHSGAVTIYNHSRQPRRTGSSQLPEASYSPDVGFGHKVRFRDPAEAAVKYSNFNRVPRTATQGYDMNILQVTRVKTTVTVQWQDGSIATLPSVSLVPYDNVDDHDVWPGMLVSLKAEEVENKDADVTICQKIGVVQTADAAERVARIRWFADPIATIPRWDPYESVSPTKFGPISDDVNEVSFYDIVPHPALARSRGDMLIVVPNPLPPIDRVGAVQNGEYQEMVNEVYWNLKEDFDHTPSSNHIPQHRFRRNAFTSSDQDPSASNTAPQSSTDIDWFGEVVDLGLDGKMTVRLGAADEVRDIDLPYERAVLVASHGGNGQETDDEDSDEDSDETWEGGFATGDDSDRDHDVIFSLDVQYAGGRRLDASSNEEAWSTEDDEEMPDLIDISPASENQGRASPSENELPDLMPLSTRPGIASQQLSDEEMPDLRDFSAPSEQVGRQSGEEKMPGQIDAPAEDTQNLGQPTDTEHSTTSTSIPTRAELSTLVMAIQFSVISGPPPNDHHYYSKSPSLTSAKMRRITKEHQIMQSSLPEGVFVRAWEARLDLLRVLIIGPRETPYELAPFVIDFYFSDEFPSKPPEAYFHSWTNGVGRVNPNLYEDGNICLSLLGTWPGDTGKDTWSAKGSTMLQVIVSILGLVLVKEPYYNEAGFEVIAGSADSSTSSAQYTERAFVLSRGFVQALLEKRPGGMNDVTECMYLATDGPQLLKTVIEEAKTLLQTGGEGLGFGNGNKRLSRGAAILLERTVKSLEEYAANRAQQL